MPYVLFLVECSFIIQPLVVAVLELFGAVSVQGHAQGNGSGGSSDVVQSRPSQDLFRSGHGRTLPGDDAHPGNGLAESHHHHFL